MGCKQVKTTNVPAYTISMKKTTLKEIAKIAGVVPSTVSFVLNGKAKEMRISNDLSARIKSIAEQTGYIPNQVAVSLRTGYSKILGLIVEDISNVFFATLAKIIEDEVQLFGYRVVYCSSENDKKKGSELINMLYHRQVDGYIITPAPGMEKSVKGLLNQHKPVVLVDRFFPGIPASYVLVDNYLSTQKGIEYLISKGYKNIGFITTERQMVQMQQREQAYIETMEKHGLTIDQSNILALSYFTLENAAIAAVTEFLQQNQKLDAAFFATNYLGIYGLQSIKNLKWDIPEKIAVMCFDDHDIFKLYSPGITSIQQPLEEIAKRAAACVIDQIEGRRDVNDYTSLKLPGTLIIRGSA